MCKIEDEIMNGWRGKSNEPMVTVLAICYNHEKYLRQALDSILMQETDFPVEVIVHDDASPDSSAEIIQEYADRYPEIIHPVLERKNQYSRGACNILEAVMPYLKGKYLAFLECDDYWTDPQKLQKQVDFLEAHPDYIAVAHNCMVVDEKGIQTEELYPECKEPDYSVQHYFSGILAGQFATIVIRNLMRWFSVDLSLLLSTDEPPDQAFNFILSLNGRVRCMQKCMSAYRHVTQRGTSYSATYRFNLEREFRYYSGFANYCAKQGKLQEAIGMQRRVVKILKNFQKHGFTTEREIEPYLSDCFSSISHMEKLIYPIARNQAPAQANRYMENRTCTYEKMVIYVQKQEESEYTESKSCYSVLPLCRDYGCAVSLRSFGEISKFRIEPMECPCFLRKITAKLLRDDGEQVSAEIMDSNGIECCDGIVFDKDDPWLEFRIQRDRYESLSFQCELLSIDCRKLEYLQAVSNELACLRQENSVLQENLNLKETEGDRLNLALKEQRATISALTEQLTATRNEFNIISNAAFWKMTKPARAVLDAFKKLYRKL